MLSAAVFSFARRLSVSVVRTGWIPSRLDGRLLLVMGLISLAAGSLWAGPPSVRFDVGHLVECREVTTPEFAQANPDERLFEATFPVSSLIQEGNPDSLLQYVYRIESPRKTLQMVDHLPKTTLATNVVGNVGVETTKERSHNLGVTVSGQYHDLATGGADAGLQGRSNTAVRYELLPPMELLAASGTVERGSGVYFKLKPSPRTSLEGAREFLVVLRVPRDWQGDYVHVNCQAVGSRRGLVPNLDEQTVCGSGTFVVALYAAGNEAAKGVAKQLVRSELELRRTAALHERGIRKRSFPSVAHQVAAALDMAEPRIPRHWFEHVLYGYTSTSAQAFVEHLPAEVATAVERYALAKYTLHRLSGWR